MISMLKYTDKLPLSRFCFLNFFEQLGGEDEVVEVFVGGAHDLCGVASPAYASLADEDDVLADAEDGVHVVGVDDGGDAIFLCDAMKELVDDEAGLRVES